MADTGPSDFYEEDEPLEDVLSAWHGGEKGITKAPTGEPMVRVTEYEVSILPRDDINYRHYAVKVQYRTNDKWAITNCGECLRDDGQWEHESNYGREPDWTDRHWFTLDDALTRAKAAAPDVNVNGRTARQALALANERSRHD